MRTISATLFGLVLGLSGVAGAAVIHSEPGAGTVTDSWCDGAAWDGGVVPTTGDMAVIDAGEMIRVGPGCDTPPVSAIELHGTLLVEGGTLTIAGDGSTFQADAATSAVSARVDVHDGGLLRQTSGTINVPGVDPALYTGGPDGEATDPGLYVHSGGTLQLDGADKTAWSHLAVPAVAGQTSIQVTDAAGWVPGDQLIVAASLPGDQREHYDSYSSAQIVSVVGSVVTLDTPLSFDHPFSSQGAAPEVHNQISDVKVVAPYWSIMVMAGGSLDVDGAQLDELGGYDPVADAPRRWPASSASSPHGRHQPRCRHRGARPQPQRRRARCVRARLPRGHDAQRQHLRHPVGQPQRRWLAEHGRRGTLRSISSWTGSLSV